MTTSLRAPMVAVLALSLGCGSSSALGPGENGNLALAGGAEDPPHVFTARTHPPRVRPAAAKVDTAALPKLVERSTQCFSNGFEEPQPIAASPSGPKKKRKAKSSKGAVKSSGHVPYNPGGVAGGATPTTTTPTAKPSSNAPKKSPAKPATGQTKPAEPAPDPAAPPSSAPPAPTADAESDEGMSFGSAGAARSASADDGAAALRSDRKAEKAAERESRRDRRRNKDSKPLAFGNADREMPAQQAPSPDDQFDDWGRATYLSNDDSMSLSSAQRVIHAIDRFLPLPLEHIRPHELLNYFSFHTQPVAQTDDFSVLAEIAEDPETPGIYNLGLAVAARPLDRDTRRNTALTFAIDRSGSMADEGRMEYLKQGLRRMLDELKPGDVVHLSLFDDQVCTPIENFVVGRDPRRILEAAIEKIQPRGSTDVHLGLQTAYAIADRSFVPEASNRVVLVTDALANTGVTDEESIALIGHHYDSRRIRLSGIGVGTEFNDSLLDKLTERGHGAYVFLGSPAEVDAVFGARFVSLVETVADDVHFQLHLPPSMRMNVFYGEESSSVKEDVQAIHYFANTTQLFLSDLMARGGKMRPQDSIMLTVEYDDPETGDAMVEEFAFELGDISETQKNLAKGRLLIHFVDNLALMASRPLPGSWSTSRESWTDPDAFETCGKVDGELDAMARGIDGDPEVQRVLGLWDRHCSRFARVASTGAVRRASPEQGWPAARGK